MFGFWFMFIDVGKSHFDIIYIQTMIKGIFWLLSWPFTNNNKKLKKKLSFYQTTKEWLFFNATEALIHCYINYEGVQQ